MNQYNHKRIEKKWQRVWKGTGLYRTRNPKNNPLTLFGNGDTTPASEDGSTPFIKGDTTPDNADFGTPFTKGDTTTPSSSLETEGRKSVRQGLRIKDKKFYILDMFPYPSGEGLHVGHPKGYIATDVYSRMKRMQGYSILHPMGWDAFGLPAENYAIQNKIHPSVAVKKNIKRFKKQLELLGFNYDWGREINTTDPNYYKWTQWIFLQMFHRGLAYRSNEPINWCPSCKTGLANEDLEDGKCERCESIVEKRLIPQWVLKITDYADRLLADLDGLQWPEYIKESQRNWIGRSEGALIKFQITSTKFQTNPKSQAPNSKLGEVGVFTTRPDTLFGATYLVLAPEIANEKFKKQNEKLQLKIQNWEEIEKYISEARKKTEIERTAEGKEKTGVELQGVKAVNPANGEEIPVWVADYVLADYGTGAIMAVPAHDERDFEFAKKFNLPIKMVVCPHCPALTCPILDKAYLGNGHMVDSGKFNGMVSEEAKKAITEFVGGRMVTKYKLRDWVFSRQRYWGEPIPLIFCANCRKLAENPKSEIRNPKQNPKSKIINHKSFSKGELLNPGWVGVSEEKLPVKLPNVESYEPTGTGESPLAAITSFVNTKCPKCGGSARRETNTMPQWAGSCWYYIAYCISERHKSQYPNSKQILDFKSQKSKRAIQKWLPVDMYVGGAEHATRHLIYARFWHKFLQDIDVVKDSEPFQRLQNVGLILASDGRKMSKRYGNVVNPDEVVERFGADALRVYEMFMGPFSQAISWNTDSLVGARRFLERVWRLRLKIKDLRLKKEKRSELKSDNLNLKSILHQTIKKVTEDIEHSRFNTAVSALMILANALEKGAVVERGLFSVFLSLLAPFAPHITEELWCSIGFRKSVHKAQWPQYDTAFAESASATIVVQINGKTRGDFIARRDVSQNDVVAQALSLPVTQKWIVGKEIKRTIVVPNRLINIVVA